MCGNGILETGEECDEGGEGEHTPGGSDELCCDPWSCRLKTNAKCSPYNSLCCNYQCQYQTSEKSFCTPWNYFPNVTRFCFLNDDVNYCSLKKINVHCEKVTVSTIENNYYRNRMYSNGKNFYGEGDKNEKVHIKEPIKNVTLDYFTGKLILSIYICKLKY